MGVCLRHHAVGVVVVVIAHGVILNVDVDHAEYEEADIRKLLLILGVLTVHSFPEGVAIAIPLRAMDVPERRMVWWAVFSSLPQPVGAAVAFAFVRLARRFLPFGFGFAAGATTYLVLTEFIPEALETGAGLPLGGKPQLAGGLAAGVLVVLPLLAV